MVGTVGTDSSEYTILSNEDLTGAIVSNEETGDIEGWNKYKVTLNWLSPVLGTTPADPKTLVTWRDMAASKGDRKNITIIAENEDGSKAEVIAAEDGVEVKLDEERQGHTAFWRQDGKPCVMSYQMRGFIINAVTVLKEDEEFKVPGRQAGKNADPIRLFRNNVNVSPFAIPLADKIDGIFGRTVRGMTMAGPRISINVSEVVLRPKPSTFVLSVRENSKITESMLVHALEYGQIEGISQWRSAGWGKFRASIETV